MSALEFTLLCLAIQLFAAFFFPRIPQRTPGRTSIWQELLFLIEVLACTTITGASGFVAHMLKNGLAPYAGYIIYTCFFASCATILCSSNDYSRASLPPAEEKLLEPESAPEVNLRRPAFFDNLGR